MIRMTRAVQRKGKRVELTTLVGGFVGRPYVYELPTITLAKMLEELARKQEAGIPSSIGPEWHRYQVT